MATERHPPTPDQPGDLPAGTSVTERRWAVAAHLSAFVTFVGIPSLVGPFVVWLIRPDHPFVRQHCDEALNFNISVLLYLVVGGVVVGVVVALTLGFALIAILPLLAVVFIVWVVLVILAAVRASRGEPYRYPATIRFVG